MFEKFSKLISCPFGHVLKLRRKQQQLKNLFNQYKQIALILIDVYSEKNIKKNLLFGIRKIEEENI
jgi:hypothetical protein